MPKTTTTLSTCLRRVQRIADAYVSISGDDPQDFTTDLLADLQHWAAAEGVRFGVSLMRAQGHFTAEQIEEARRH
jgi:hypothetical protein